MKELWKKHHEKIMLLLVFGVLFVGLMSVIAVLGGAVMKLFGFQYKSVGSIIGFFIIATIISYPVNLIAGVLPKVLLSLEKVSKPVARILYLVLDTAATASGLWVVDHFMNSVTATGVSIIVVSFVLALLGIGDIVAKPIS